jgi:hypothetical protein
MLIESGEQPSATDQGLGPAPGQWGGARDDPGSPNNCVYPIACCECIAETPCLRIPSILCCSFCVGCYGEAAERKVSVDNMHGNDGTVPSCTREIANRLAARNAGCGRLSCWDSAWLAGVVAEYTAALAICGIAVVVIHVIVAAAIIWRIGCTPSPCGGRVVACAREDGHNVTALSHPSMGILAESALASRRADQSGSGDSLDAPVSSSSAIWSASLSRGTNGTKAPHPIGSRRDNVIAEAMARTCPALASMTTTRNFVIVLIIPSSGAVCIVAALRSAGWTYANVVDSFRRARAKRRHEV